MKRRMSYLLVLALLCSLCMFATVGEAEAAFEPMRMEIASPRGAVRNDGWVFTGREDSVTGYDPSGRIARGAWFMYNTVHTSDMRIGDTVTFDLQAGEYKNGTNIVGQYSVKKVGDYQFKVSYQPEQQDGARKVKLDDARIWVNGTGSFRTSPGNQKGMATAVKGDEVFTFTGDTMFIFTHFVCTYWEWQGREFATYTVQYMDMASSTKIAEDKVVTGVVPGTIVTEVAAEIENYTSFVKSIEFEVTGDDSVIFVYYLSGGQIVG